MPLRSWIEPSSWALGLGLMLFCGTARVWSERARAEGVRAFQAARMAPETVDQSLWSRQRISAFAATSVSAGVPEGLLRIPSVALEVPVYAGASELNLNRGAGHIEGTSALTQLGNVGIAGHRDGFFRKLKDVTLNSEIDLEAGGRLRRYQVVDIRIVDPSDREVLARTQVPSITLVTCYPFYFVGSAPERYIVRAELTGSTMPVLAVGAQHGFSRMQTHN
jgi:sortase A